MTDTAAQEPIKATLQDALDSGLLDIINTSDGQESYRMVAALEALMAAKNDAGMVGQAKAVHLLLWCYSMRLDAGNKTEPFQPAYRFANGTTTAKPYDLSPDQVHLLAGLYRQIKPAMRRARLADLVGLMIGQRRVDHVIVAIDAYREMPPDGSQWFDGGQQQWHRALSLAISFRPGVGTRAEEIEQALFDSFDKACKVLDGPTPLVYLRPLQAENVSTYASAIAPRLQQLADARKAKGELDGAAYAYETAGYWYGRTRQADQAALMFSERAAVTEKKADGLGSGIMRQAFFTDALRFYREVDGRYHGDLKVREAIERVQKKLEAAGIASIGEMQVVRTPGLDINVAEIVQDAVALVSGKSPLGAMVEFVEIDRWPSRSYYLTHAREVAKASIFGSLVGSTYLSADGRQVEKVHPLTGDDENDAAAIEIMAIRHFVEYAQLSARTTLSPALSQIYQEHALTLGDFLVIAGGSPVVPVAHVNAVAQGLYAGYQRDFVAALHILMPQFEHIVRTVLKSANANTTKTESDGITMEVGLSSLIDRPQMVTTFRENLPFGIRALMCSQVGPNFRNDIAHGLATSSSCNTLVGLYTWWFIFKMVFTQWYLTTQPEGGSSASDSEAPAPTTPVGTKSDGQ